ncbi:MAG: CatA-like O-acetyltransferase [Cellulosilyticaceae bacterium]
MENYKRLQHFNYFKNMAYPYVGVTCDVDITEFLVQIKAKKYPLFLSILWCVAAAANEITELRQRIYEDGIIEYHYCETSHTVAKEDGTYCYCALDCNKPFEEFIIYATEKQEYAKQYGNITEKQEDLLSLLFISTLPWISYTSLIQPVSSSTDSNPRIVWGKYYQKEGRTVLPVSILCHHALVDGRHIGDFFANLEQKLQSYLNE